MKQIMHKKLVFLFIGRTASGKSSLALTELNMALHIMKL